ncbi:signal recognition particle-docking protein FtsY [Lentilactobacillus kisonensis]|uniref:Signal recognition particle receptor FtsY n=1 Tax=Lentilactobacillus kisonensis F0435 TaxID=797516 RepID=H1LGC3_9LACO|nr:signal recognition particle-docking protein FtsY [Lentilactobacillus kisonensis]EHO51135.1 signal recognition particle-docking protein FtsY [Lentilactobacillus kisonensis F0435]
MGLFDIFKRRSKKNAEKKVEQEKKEQPTVKVATKPNSDAQMLEQSLAAKSASSESTASESSATASDQLAPSAAKSETRDEQSAASRSSDQTLSGSSNTSQQAIQKVAEPETDAVDSDESKPVTASSKSQAASDSSDQLAATNESDQTGGDDNATASYERGLEKSRSTFGEKLNALLANFRHVDESFFDDLEDMLIESDVGFETSMRITDELREEVKLQNAKKPKDVQNVIVKKLIDMYDKAGNGENPAINMAKSGPTVLLFVGVNGVGKTTTIGKMAKMYKDQGKKVVLAAADTFRAGAIEQLNVWAERDGVDIVKGKAKSDPASVVFDAVKRARDENYDVLMVDTAGRLQNKVNLMNELSKMKKILTREIPEAPHEVLLVLDATTGQNAMTQAKMFKEATDVTGIVLTKLDGTARGGIVLAIRSELHLPVKYVGLGEQVADLKPFDPNDFVYGLFKGLISE